MPQSFVGEGSVGAVVIDLGNITTRVGFAGDDIPTAIYPSAMGAYNDAEGRWCCTVEMDGIGWAQPELQVKRLHNAGAGEMADLLFQQLCEHGLQKLRVQPRDTPLLITEAATATAANRCRTTELVFEGLGAPALCVARTPELAAIAAGRVTSVVLEMGAFHSTSSCVVDGAMQPRSVQTSKLATGNLARLLEQQLTSKGTVLEAACCMPGARPPPLGGAAGSCSFVRESQTRPSARPTEDRPPLTPAYSEQLKKLRREVRTIYAYPPALTWTPAPTSRTSPHSPHSRISPHLPASPRISLSRSSRGSSSRRCAPSRSTVSPPRRASKQPQSSSLLQSTPYLTGRSSPLGKSASACPSTSSRGRALQRAARSSSTPCTRWYATPCSSQSRSCTRSWCRCSE